jgi:hypothetical protein
MKNTLTDLHNHLFETLEALKDTETRWRLNGRRQSELWRTR